LDEQVITDQITQATQAYEAALQKAKGNASLTAMATFGLGLCAEELGDFEKAVQIYSDIAQNTEFEGTLFPAQAQFRLEILEDNKETFVFVAVPKVELPKGIDPALKEAIESGQIYFEGAEPKSETPAEVPAEAEGETTTEAEPEAEPEPSEKPADSQTKEE
jgi:hypothetical protein